ncbi:MAG: hypothetical protein CENE_01654 [Candidatus Celerinatantimonas neptuna]|nr:MAG: hypothetical protein CENE_01654 [Candidatus Celerinatantimonas neptuna]
MRRQKTTVALDDFEKTLNELPKDEGWQTYHCTLVTPMYGGGVKAGEVDKAMPIRASSIRGQLRFWWRIACGPDDPNELFKQEKAIWGGIGTKETPYSNDNGMKQTSEFKDDDKAKKTLASRVKIRVEKCAQSNNTIIANRLINTKDIKGEGAKYVFGAAEATDCLPSGYAFLLKIYCAEDVKEDVQQTLRWWATFGGIGSRTRRGLGAVRIDGMTFVNAEQVREKGGQLALSSYSFSSPEQAWKEATSKLYQFRQGRGIGRDRGSERPGRSFWPEPDALRRLSRRYKKKHAPEHPAGNYFPRAVFGMPIIFDFNDKTKKEPITMALLPEGHQRLASPLILRPYLKDNQWYAAALLIPDWKCVLDEPLALDPSIDKVSPAHWPSDAVERNKIANQINPMKHNGTVRANDPLSAFLDYFKKGK